MGGDPAAEYFLEPRSAENFANEFPDFPSEIFAVGYDKDLVAGMVRKLPRRKTNSA
jgi:hypothetical protein